MIKTDVLKKMFAVNVDYTHSLTTSWAYINHTTGVPEIGRFFIAIHYIILDNSSPEKISYQITDVSGLPNSSTSWRIFSHIFEDIIKNDVLLYRAENYLNKFIDFKHIEISGVGDDKN
jgi:hypothetical protein